MLLLLNTTLSNEFLDQLRIALLTLSPKQRSLMLGLLFLWVSLVEHLLQEMLLLILLLG